MAKAAMRITMWRVELDHDRVPHGPAHTVYVIHTPDRGGYSATFIAPDVLPTVHDPIAIPDDDLDAIAERAVYDASRGQEPHRWKVRQVTACRPVEDTTEQQLRRLRDFHALFGAYLTETPATPQAQLAWDRLVGKHESIRASLGHQSSERL